MSNARARKLGRNDLTPTSRAGSQLVTNFAFRQAARAKRPAAILLPPLLAFCLLSLSIDEAFAAEAAKPEAALAYAAEPARTPDAPGSPALEAIGEATNAPQATAPVVKAPKPKVMSAALREARRTGKYLIPPEVTASRERECLANAIYFEARGESRRGQIAVAQVVLNRVRSPDYPDTICNVVYQNSHKKGCQFSFACDGIPDTITEKAAWARAQAIAEEFTSGRLLLTEVAGATHYHARYVSPKWAPEMQRLARIGQHIFYRG